MRDGEEIAVKRLDKASGQGIEQLRNELLFVAKLRHNNLAKLLGVCIKGEEKLLVYEYLPNRSLDTFHNGTNNNSTTLHFCYETPSSLESFSAVVIINMLTTSSIIA